MQTIQMPSFDQVVDACARVHNRTNPDEPLGCIILIAFALTSVALAAHHHGEIMAQITKPAGPWKGGKS